MAHDTLPERQPGPRTGDDPAAAGAADPAEGRDADAGPASGPGEGRWARIRRGGRAGWPRHAVTATAGLLLWLAFPPVDLPYLGPLAVALLTLAWRGVPARTAAWLGFVGGAVFFLPVLEGIHKVGWDGWVLLSLVQALYFIPLAAGTAVVTRLPAWPLWTAAGWVAEEALRGRQPFGGFPWARLAFSQTATPLTPYASLGGAPLVTFLTALVGGLIAYAAVTAWRLRRDVRPATGQDTEQGGEQGGELGAVQNGPSGRGRGLRGPLLGAAVALVLAGLVVGGGTAIPTPASGRPVTVAVVQGNVPRLGLDFLGQRRAVLDNHVRETKKLAADVRAGRVARPQLVIWPENASDLDPFTEPDAFQAIDGAVRDIGVPVLVGALVDTPDGTKVENRGIVWDPRTGPGDYYVKRHPVPFGEYLPFRDVLTKLITRFQRISRDFVKGNRSGVMRLGPITVGDVICFEVAYDKETRDSAPGNVMVVQTNNATYGETSLPPQQIAMSRLRAVEHGRTVLVAATSGISAIVAPDGRMIARSKEFVPAVQVAAVPARTSTTMADRVGALPEWALTLTALGAVAAALGLARRRRTAAPADGPAPAPAPDPAPDPERAPEPDPAQDAAGRDAAPADVRDTGGQARTDDEEN
ncbi:apolipoprotein N-acyltransferase [Actinomadura rupiterrae]|uniref:apolipoprotein N-acyltransferase n=1 Tax=Actinomadura rupiterrae TaxID=559627 RepID=UPI0020A56248|nr:apolipoprotein N-acyltransferase [Actinomadura rupiterrae]MCP2342652.1 apolipoprotein N-acyltransferase [Actinomadura rupiterrae]